MIYKKMTMTGPQRRFLREVDRWGEWSPDLEDQVGCFGAALTSVMDACHRRGWISYATGGIDVTDAGRAALANS